MKKFKWYGWKQEMGLEMPWPLSWWEKAINYFLIVNVFVSLITSIWIMFEL